MPRTPRKGREMARFLTIAAALTIIAGCGSQQVSADEARHMSKQDSTALLLCQTYKYKHDVGKAQAREFVTKSLFQGPPTPNHLQVAFIEKKGVSCTRDEMDSYRGAM